ncbi:enoyl-CoA hydratase/isomerase family protein [Aeromonas diversa CDC 2478-85]|uniref:3-hydroxyisobutyryl-CoA hydrolase n=1 Tax=Aeromonas diversa CDC 2478-85 TaxID=1268237 RepID=N9TWG4_9GAMM|nr:enoyl-CoA hydratase/isomerase family protein [Aeromonas diversa]ENY70469.1 enoyl-CoA hydratase/isomerase family protein [Aeromonas diversa CDC 2478-85]
MTIHVSYVPLPAGERVGVLTLDAPASLNALSLPMIRTLAQQLGQWASDPTVRAVWLEGGEKAFCAGGDIRSFYHLAQEQPVSVLGEYATDFFEQEYRLDHAIHTYPKPILCLGHGIVMGGGIGLLAGARFRILTEQSLLAMPEVSIGLYPDVAGSWFLSRMPGRLGLWLGLTGARFNGSDALALGMADALIPAARRAELKERLQALDWRLEGEALDEALFGLIDRLGERMPAPEPLLLPHREQIETLMAGRSLDGILVRLFAADLAPWPALASAQASCRGGSPISRAIAWQQYGHARHLSLAGVFAEELTLSVNCVLEGDFLEGVRALLIDKDKSPRWRFATQGEVPADWLADMWRWRSGANPLAHQA